MTDYGLVSIITPCYNSGKYIAQMIGSILAQTYPNWELLVTDDCSTDNSREIVEEFCKKDPRVKLLVLERNLGAGVARNNSIEAASGRYIAFCDSDDLWKPEKLERQLAFMAEQGCALSYTSYMLCDETGHGNGIVVCPSRETFSSIKRDCGIGCLTAVYDTQQVGKVFMPSLRKRQDWGLWMKILSQCGYACGLKEPLASYRQRSNSLSRNKLSLIKYNVAVYRQVLGWQPLRAYLYFWCVFAPTYAVKKIMLHYINR